MNPTTPKAHRITPAQLYFVLQRGDVEGEHVLHGFATEAERAEKTRLLIFGEEISTQDETDAWLAYREELTDKGHISFEGDPGLEWFEAIPELPHAPPSIPSPVSSQDSEGTGHVRSQADGNSAGFWKRELEYVERNDGPSRPNQPAQEAALKAAEEIQSACFATHHAYMSPLSVEQAAAIILKHCFPAPSLGAAKSDNDELLAVRGSLSRAQHFIGAGNSSKAKWNVMDAKLRIERLISPGEPEALSKPAAPMLPGGEAELRAQLATAIKERDDARQVIAGLQLGPPGWRRATEINEYLKEEGEKAAERYSQLGNLEKK